MNRILPRTQDGCPASNKVRRQLLLPKVMVMALPLLLLTVGCCQQEGKPPATEPKQPMKDESRDPTEILLSKAVGTDALESRFAAAELCILLTKRTGRWLTYDQLQDTDRMVVLSEKDFPLEVRAYSESDQKPEYSLDNLGAHCMGMVPHGAWRTPPTQSSDPLEERCIEVVKNARDPAVRVLLLAGLATSSTTKARDAVVAATLDSELGVRKVAMYLIERLTCRLFAHTGNIHIGSSPESVEEAAAQVRMFYRWDKTFGAGWGRMARGLLTRLAPSNTDIRAGQPLKISFVVRNLRDEPVDFGGLEYPLRFLNASYDAKRLSWKVSSPEDLGQRLPKPTIIEPGQQSTLWVFDPHEYFDMSLPGEYEIWIAHDFADGFPHSNRIKIRVAELSGE